MQGLRFPGITLLSLCLLGCGSGFPSLAPFEAQSTWQRYGTVVSGTAAEEYSAQEPTVIHEGSSVLFDAKAEVFKMWFSCGWSESNICYAESADGFNFVRYNEGKPIIAGTGRSFVFRLDSTYYCYTTKEVNGLYWDRYESTDGVHWTLTAPQTLKLDSSAPWEQIAGNIFVWTENSTWYAVYEALGKDSAWRVGLATSTDGILWMKEARNPVISYTSCGGPEIHKVATTYYMWAQCSARPNMLASDIYRWRSTDLINWTPEVVELWRSTPDEGSLSLDGSQVADPSMVEVNGKVYMYYDATRTQNPTSAEAIHVKLAVANMNFAALVAKGMK
jgi:hypothetical protein